MDDGASLRSILRVTKRRSARPTKNMAACVIA